MTITMMTITPELAASWLANTTRNRKLSKEEVKMITADILSGRWEGENGETIKIGENGEVIDGNHRLTAVVNANVPIKAYVIFGVKPSTKIDVGMRRNLVQGLYMSGLSEPKTALSDEKIISGITFALKSETNQFKRSANITPDDVYEFYAQHQYICDTVYDIYYHKDMKSTRVPCRKACIMYAMMAALNDGVESDVLNEWYKILCTGIYDAPATRSMAAAKSIILFRNHLFSRGALNNMEGKIVTLTKAMSSIQHFNNDEAIKALKGAYCFANIIKKGE